MKVAVHLFARARDLAGAEVVTVNVPEGGTVADLRRALADCCPSLVKLLPHAALAINNDFVGDFSSVPLNAEVALLPPVSGG